MMKEGQTMKTTRPIVAEDLFGFRFLRNADLDPDGRAVVYSLSRTDAEANSDHIDLHLLDTDTGASRRLTNADGVHSAPVFSPDSGHIAFMSTRNETPQIFVMPTDGGEARQITSMQHGVAGGPVFSPDGARIAFTAVPEGEPRDPSKPYRVTRAIWRDAEGVVVDDAVQDIYVVDAASGEPDRLTTDPSMKVNPVWAADGESIIYVSSQDPADLWPTQRLRRVGLDGSVTDLVEGDAVWGHAPCPDGRIVYTLGESDKRPGSKVDLWVLDPATGTRERRTAGLDVGVGGVLSLQTDDMGAFPLFAMNLSVSEDGTHAFAPVQRGGEIAIFRIALSGPEAYEPVVEGQRACAPVRLRGETLLFFGSGVCEPGDLYLVDALGSNERRLTRLNADLLAELDLPSVRRLEFESTDGATVEGWFLEPVGGEAPYPSVLGIHGGPHSGWGYAFNFDFLMFAGAGFGVLFVNQRGSTGYGDEFATKINANWGNLDYADLMAAVDHATGLGLADPDRLGVFGLSGGGYLTGWIIGHTDRFKAACPENPVFNFFSLYGTSDIGLWMGQRMLGCEPHERREVFERCSPIFSAHACSTPTLFLQHENDFRTPPEQSEQYYAVLKDNGVTAEMLRFPGTGHGGSILGPVSHRRVQNEALLDWMTRHVLGRNHRDGGS